MATPNRVRINQLDTVVEAAERMLGMQAAAKKVSEEIQEEKEEEEAG